MTTQEKLEWSGKDDLPAAAELHALLEQGTSCTVNGHYLKSDEQSVWITNPYGLDCVLWQDLTMQRVEEFLRDMASDKEYGPAP